MAPDRPEWWAIERERVEQSLVVGPPSVMPCWQPVGWLGRPCGRPAWVDSGYCPEHEPASLTADRVTHPEAELAPLAWRTEPGVAGWYWFKRPGGPTLGPVHVWWHQDELVLVPEGSLGGRYRPCWRLAELGWEWAGPVARPIERLAERLAKALG